MGNSTDAKLINARDLRFMLSGLCIINNQHLFASLSRFNSMKPSPDRYNTTLLKIRSGPSWHGRHRQSQASSSLALFSNRFLKLGTSHDVTFYVRYSRCVSLSVFDWPATSRSLEPSIDRARIASHHYASKAGNIQRDDAHCATEPTFNGFITRQLIREKIDTPERPCLYTAKEQRQARM